MRGTAFITRAIAIAAAFPAAASAASLALDARCYGRVGFKRQVTPYATATTFVAKR